jgi:hypothetical protein
MRHSGRTKSQRQIESDAVEPFEHLVYQTPISPVARLCAIGAMRGLDSPTPRRMFLVVGLRRLLVFQLSSSGHSVRTSG